LIESILNRFYSDDKVRFEFVTRKKILLINRKDGGREQHPKEPYIFSTIKSRREDEFGEVIE